jgi:hypothetical protein
MKKVSATGIGCVLPGEESRTRRVDDDSSSGSEDSDWIRFENSRSDLLL